MISLKFFLSSVFLFILLVVGNFVINIHSSYNVPKPTPKYIFDKSLLDGRDFVKHSAIIPITPTPTVSVCPNYELTNPLLTTAIASKLPVTSLPLKTIPQWIQSYCPEVIAHFSLFPYPSSFKGGRKSKTKPQMVYQTAEYAIKSTCLVKIFSSVATSVGAEHYLYAGAHLGAVIHGGLIPWDDDIDVILDYKKKKEFVDLCNNFSPVEGVNVRCVYHWNAVKLFVEAPPDDHIDFKHGGGSADPLRDVSLFNSPFVDICMLRMDDKFVYERSPSGKEYGITFERSRCYMAKYNHRLERWFVPPETPKDQLELNCCELEQAGYPFVRTRGKVEELRSFSGEWVTLVSV
ncbi:hypothetical protein ScalyP_jg7526 [Parmales sp. scaly parma]|nr:hypothetical protein ScalyP_jg7526 [Parmales sp. scaly parma]